MNSNTEIKTLGECCLSIEDGDWIKTNDQSESGYRLLQVSNIGLGHFRETGNFRWVNDATFKRLKCKAIQVGDVLVARMPKPTGRCWYVDKLPWSAITAVDVAIIRTNPRLLDALYCSYFLNSPQTLSAVEVLTIGTTRIRIKRTDLASLKLNLPPLEVQQKVASTLRALDNRIALLRENSLTIDELLQLTFKAWFIDFEPVLANSVGNLSQSADKGTSKLFPNSFIESDLGQIPSGWEVKTIGEIIDTYGGATPDTKTELFWNPPLHHWTSPKDLSGIASPVLLNTDRGISSDGLKKISSGLLPAGTLLMSSRAPIGYLAVSQIPLATNQGYIAMTPGGTLSPLFMLYWCRANMKKFKFRAHGSTFMEISKKAFRPIPIVLPAANVTKKFNDFASILFEKITENEKSIETLAALRDTLLPRLISGQLNVHDAEL